jgi:hypothetical protein
MRVCCRSPCLTKLDVIALCEAFAQASLSLEVLVCCDIFRLECLIHLRFLLSIKELRLEHNLDHPGIAARSS